MSRERSRLLAAHAKASARASLDRDYLDLSALARDRDPDIVCVTMEA